jgi:hypothetical protein
MQMVTALVQSIAGGRLGGRLGGLGTRSIQFESEDSRISEEEITQIFEEAFRKEAEKSGGVSLFQKQNPVPDVTKQQIETFIQEAIAQAVQQQRGNQFFTSIEPQTPIPVTQQPQTKLSQQIEAFIRKAIAQTVQQQKGNQIFTSIKTQTPIPVTQEPQTKLSQQIQEFIKEQMFEALKARAVQEQGLLPSTITDNNQQIQKLFNQQRRTPPTTTSKAKLDQKHLDTLQQSLAKHSNAKSKITQVKHESKAGGTKIKVQNVQKSPIIPSKSNAQIKHDASKNSKAKQVVKQVVKQGVKQVVKD